MSSSSFDFQALVKPSSVIANIPLHSVMELQSLQHMKLSFLNNRTKPAFEAIAQTEDLVLNQYLIQGE